MGNRVKHSCMCVSIGNGDTKWVSFRTNKSWRREKNKKMSRPIFNLIFFSSFLLLLLLYCPMNPYGLSVKRQESLVEKVSDRYIPVFRCGRVSVGRVGFVGSAVVVLVVEQQSCCIEVILQHVAIGILGVGKGIHVNPINTTRGMNGIAPSLGEFKGLPSLTNAKRHANSDPIDTHTTVSKLATYGLSPFKYHQIQQSTRIRCREMLRTSHTANREGRGQKIAQGFCFSDGSHHGGLKGTPKNDGKALVAWVEAQLHFRNLEGDLRVKTKCPFCSSSGQYLGIIQRALRLTKMRCIK
jgi:hypothetical protein